MRDRHWTMRGHVSSVPEDIVALEPGMDTERDWKEREEKKEAGSSCRSSMSAVERL